MMKLLVLLSLLLSACSGLNQAHEYSIGYRDNIYAGKCEEAEAYIPREMNDTMGSRFYRETVGYIVYFTSLPITVGFDFLTTFRCGQGGTACPPDARKLPYEDFIPSTAHSYEVTKEFRCPDTRYYVQKSLEVSECFERRGDRGSLEQALVPLNDIEARFDSLATCIAYQDHFVAKNSKFRVEEKLSKLPPQLLIIYKLKP